MSFQKKDLPSQQLRQRYEGGESMESLSIAFQVTRQTISSHLRQAGTKIRNRRNGRAAKPGAIARMRELREAGVKYEAIAFEMGVSVTTVYAHLKPLTNPHRPVLLEMLGLLKEQLERQKTALEVRESYAYRKTRIQTIRTLSKRIAALESVV